MDRLGEITISGFRSIRVIDNLALKPINILIGANGAGKGRLRIPDEQGIKSSPETRAGRIESAPPHGGLPYRRTSFSIHNRPHQEEEEAQTTGPAREKGSGQDHRQQATDKASPQQNARGDSGRRRDKPGGPPGVRTGQEQEPRAHGVQPAPCPGTAADSQGNRQVQELSRTSHPRPDPLPQVL